MWRVFLGERKNLIRGHKAFGVKTQRKWQNEAEQTDGIVQLQNRNAINGELADLSAVSD